MPEDERLRLEDIRHHSNLVLDWVHRLTEAEFIADDKTKGAVAMSLLVIGETVTRLRPETKLAAPMSIGLGWWVCGTGWPTGTGP